MKRNPDELPSPDERRRRRPQPANDALPPPPPPKESVPFADVPPDVPPPVDEEKATLWQQIKLRRLAAELARRRIEGLALYEPLPMQERFHACEAPERVVRGSNRAGKTLAAAIEVARAVTGQDPHHKYPEREDRAFLVGKDGKHLAQVMYRKLFRAGAFKMIRDADTALWRAFRPWDSHDLDREAQAKPAGPLIPQRFIKEIAWENKKENIPNVVRLVNGWELAFFSSLGKPPQGSDVGLVWLDEEIVDPSWYPEMSARLLDRHGKLIWSATPQAGTDHLFDLHEKAVEQDCDDHPRVVEFVSLLDDNPHIDPEQKRLFIEKLSEEERRVRVLGEFALSSYRVYPEFSMATTHGRDWFEVPRDWTRYLVVDPGHQVCAVLFAAVPPDDDRLYLFDELYIQNCNAELFGEQMGKRCSDYAFQAFLIDHHAGRQTEISSGKTHEQQYSEALMKYGVKSVQTGFNFLWGSDDVPAGIEAVRSLLRIREDGTTKLQVLRDKLPNFDREIKRYHYKRVGGVVTDMPDQRRDNHLMDCLRYLAMYRPRYVKPPRHAPVVSYALRALQAKRDRKRQKEGSKHVSLGPKARRP